MLQGHTLSKPSFITKFMVMPSKVIDKLRSSRVASAAAMQTDSVASEGSEDEGREGIDVRRLGHQPLGKQTNRMGPKSTKFVCNQCRKTRWIIDSEAGKAADLHRLSTCLFCDLKRFCAEEVQKVGDSLTRDLQSLEARLMQRLEGQQEQGGTPSTPLPPVEAARGVDSGEVCSALAEFRTSQEIRLESLTKVLESLLTELRRGQVREPTQSGAVSPLESHSSRGVGGSPSSVTEAMTCIDTAYRRYSVAGTPGGVATRGSPSSGVPPPEEEGRTFSQILQSPRPASTGKPRGVTAKDTSSRPSVPVVGKAQGAKPQEKKKRKKRRKKSGKGATNSGTQSAPKTKSSACRREQPSNYLVGDSLVGRTTGHHFSTLRRENTFSSIPGAGINRIMKKVKSMDVSRDSTLVLAVGGNDCFPRSGQVCHPQQILEEYGLLLKTAKTRVNRVMVIGIIPRAKKTDDQYRRAWAVHQALPGLCRKFSVRYVDLWSNFWGRNALYASDGIHFSETGAKQYAELVNQKLFKPLVARSPNKPAAKGGVDQPAPPKGKSGISNPVSGSGSPATRSSTDGVGPTGPAPSPAEGPTATPSDAVGSPAKESSQPSATLGMRTPATEESTRKRVRCHSSPATSSQGSPSESLNPSKRGRDDTGATDPSPPAGNGSPSGPQP